MRDDDEDDYVVLGPDNDEPDAEYELDKSPHYDLIEKDAKDCMATFFADKKYWAGGKIANSRLFTKENVRIVMTTKMKDALEVAYKCLNDSEPEMWKTSEEDWDLNLIYELVIKQCGRKLIPKCFAGGILLVYLALCQGVDYVQTMKEYTLSLQDTYKSAT